MSTHTPGPWQTSWNEENHKARLGSWNVFNGTNPIPLRRCSPQNSTAAANARLIAAAPKLLDLARNVAGLDPAYVEKIDGPVLVVAAIREWMEQARAAIAEVEGR